MARDMHSVLAFSIFALLVGASAAVAEDPPEFIKKFGRYGSGDGQFDRPYGVAADRFGHVYVADRNLHRIQKFTSDGVFLAKFGTPGTGDGQLNLPTGVAADATGNVYVADSYNYRIQKFTSAGVYLTQWGVRGVGDGEFMYPYGLAADATHVYVMDTGNSRVQKFTLDGEFVTKWGTRGVSPGEFLIPYGIALDTASNVYVSDRANHRVQKFTSDGTFIRTWGRYGNASGQFNMPWGIATDSSDNVYVGDSNNHRIQKFTTNGQYLTQWMPVDKLSAPFGVAVDPSGFVYISDLVYICILKFGPSNQEPIADNQTLETPGNTPLPITLTGSDPDNDPLTFAIERAPVSGILTGTPPVLTYLPNANFIGRDSFTFTVNDGTINSHPATVSITVYDVTPPVISPPTITGTAGANGWFISAVTVSWMASDPESGIVTPCGATAITTDTAGTTVTCTVTNGAGLTASLSVTIRVDLSPPVITGMPANCVLWPPNGLLVPVAVISASAGISGLTAFSVSAVSNEPAIPGPDVVITGTGLQPRRVELRAERSGAGAGRIYTITAVAGNGAGVSTTIAGVCIVPHDQGK